MIVVHPLHARCLQMTCIVSLIRRIEVTPIVGIAKACETSLGEKHWLQGWGG